MHLTIHEASIYIHKLSEKVKTHRNTEVVLAPTMLGLQPLSLQIDRRQFKLAAQNLYWRDEGAFTGEVSAQQLHGLVEYAIIGHSERRHIFGEHDKEIRAKVQAAIRNDITPILCVGETAHEKNNKETAHVLHDQVVGGVSNLTSEEIENIVIAYEPVWALSDGKDFKDHPMPSAEDITQANKAIRSHIKHLYGDKAAKSIRVLYGGSSNSQNAASILAVDGIDGLLVGGASLRADEFSQMVEVAHNAEESKK